jgi:hypothetical protein
MSVNLSPVRQVQFLTAANDMKHPISQVFANILVFLAKALYYSFVVSVMAATACAPFWALVLITSNEWSSYEPRDVPGNLTGLSMVGVFWVLSLFGFWFIGRYGLWGQRHPKARPF